jgi:hypothetical protein
MSLYATATDQPITSVLSPYAKFKLALKSKEVKRQYPNLLEKFLDFCKLEGLDIEQNPQSSIFLRSPSPKKKSKIW